ncbi:5-hydroxytryptamine receptor 1E-like [Stylophora pistillata]|uniref:5-hydroxytryptamine receptor 1E-like n=1 Tax=Stylophora pistillata TaxID=50429 RepID=UPI000C0454D6|nr:5-hydroxytryptamine receptor 1E-like [Stylophora pistillata]
MFTWDLDDNTLAWTIVASLMFLSSVTILLNLLVIVTVVKRRDLQKLSNILLRSLAVSDLHVGVVSMPLSATVDVLVLHQMSVEHICDLDLANLSVIYFLSVLSLYHLTIIAWERNVAIRKGLQYQFLVTESLLIKLAIFAWLLSLFTDLPAFILTAIELDIEIVRNWVIFNYALMTVCLITIAYFNILKRKKNNIAPLTANRKMESKTAKICDPTVYRNVSVEFSFPSNEILRLKKPQPIQPPVAAIIARRCNPVGSVAEQHCIIEEPSLHVARSGTIVLAAGELDRGHLFSAGSMGSSDDPRGRCETLKTTAVVHPERALKSKPAVIHEENGPVNLKLSRSKSVDTGVSMMIYDDLNRDLYLKHDKNPPRIHSSKSE